MKLLVIDTETGGLDPSCASILSLAAVVWLDGTAIASTSLSIAEQEMLLDPNAIKVNRIDVAELQARGIAPVAAVEAFDAFLAAHFGIDGARDKILVAGHNVWFDVAFVRRLYRLAGRDFRTHIQRGLLDVTSVVNFLRLSGRLAVPSSHLDDLIAHFGIVIDEQHRHTALYDATACAEILTKLLAILPAI